MSELNYVAVKCGASRYKKDINHERYYYTSYAIILGKMVARCVKFYHKRPTDGLAIFVWLGCYSERFEDIYKALINVAEA